MMAKVKKLCPQCLNLTYGVSDNIEECRQVACMDKLAAGVGFKHHTVQSTLIEVSVDLQPPEPPTEEQLNALVKVAGNRLKYEWDAKVIAAGTEIKLGEDGRLRSQRDPAKLPKVGDVWEKDGVEISVKSRHTTIVEYLEDGTRTRYAVLKAATEALGEGMGSTLGVKDPQVWEERVAGAVLRTRAT
jgi:hypothetical protein